MLQAAAIVAHEHHERWDGKGYPRGLREEQIHIYGRIVSLVDVFDALYSDRVYRPAMELQQALRIIEEERGRQFDPVLVDVFLEHFDEFLSVLKEYKDTTAQCRAAEQSRAERVEAAPESVEEEAILV